MAKLNLYYSMTVQKPNLRRTPRIISPENYMLVTVPPLIWNGFKGVGNQSSIVANCATQPHHEGEMLRRAPDDPSIPYDWGLKNR